MKEIKFRDDKFLCYSTNLISSTGSNNSNFISEFLSSDGDDSTSNETSEDRLEARLPLFM